MAALNQQWPALRVSDADRDEVIKVLREGSADGRLSHDTFLHRMELALQARDAGQLASLLSDLRPAARRGSLAGRAATRWQEFAGQLRDAWWTMRLPRLVLPRGGRTLFTIGRAGHSDLAIPDSGVVHHAELRLVGSDQCYRPRPTTAPTAGGSVGLVARAGDEVTFGQVPPLRPQLAAGHQRPPPPRSCVRHRHPAGHPSAAASPRFGCRPVATPPTRRASSPGPGHPGGAGRRGAPPGRAPDWP